MLEAQYQIAAPLFIPQCSPSATEGRASGGTGAAQARRPNFVLEWTPAAGAGGWVEESELVPATGAQGAGVGDILPAIETAGRQQRIKQKSSGGRKHVHWSPILTATSNSVNRERPGGIVRIMSDHIAPFDRDALRRHRDRAAVDFAAYDFLFAEVAERLADRLDDITRRFPTALDLGCHDGMVARTLKQRGGIERLVQLDLSPKMAARAARYGLALAGDEERLPFRWSSFDAVLSCLSLHWTNDLPGALIQVRQALKPDGLFLAAMFGGGTLSELRSVFLDAEIETVGGASPRVSPFADLRDAAGLLQRAGFLMPVADADTITVTFENALALFRDLRGMAETNALAMRPRHFMRRDVLANAVARYGARAEGGRITATFRIIFLTAWAPSQPRKEP
jgi:NADH dehydrogenase [ubiquinone] 1 alpha subcomplex assembly factor 5